MQIPQYHGAKKQILKKIFTQKAVTRSDLSSSLNLSILTVSKTVSALINDGLIIESEVRQSSGGRRPSCLSINPNYAKVIAIDIGSYSFKIGVVALDGSIIEYQIIPNKSLYPPSPTLPYQKIENMIGHYLQKYSIEKFLGIGVSVSGIVDHLKQKIIFTPNISGLDSNIVERLKNSFGLPVKLDSSARCMALAEKTFGTFDSLSNFLFVSIGYGISAALVADSKLLLGSQGFSGELGHFKVSDDEMLCTCGNQGCLELYVTIPMIVGKVQEILSSINVFSTLKQISEQSHALTISDVAEAYRNGDKTVIRVVQEAASKLGLALSMAINLVNPKRIILGGGLPKVFPEIIDETSRYVLRNSLTPSVQDLIISTPSFIDDSAIVGTAAQFIVEAFDAK